MLESFAGDVFVVGICAVAAVALVVRLIFRLVTGSLRFVLLGLVGVLLLVFCIVISGLASL